MADKKKKNTGFGIACCLLVALVIFIIFLVQRKTIIENLKDTNLFERMGVKTPKVVEEFEIPQVETEDEVAVKEESFTIQIENEKKDSGKGEQAVADGRTESKPSEKPVEAVDTKKESSTGAKTGSESDAAKTQDKPTTVTTQIKYMELQLCFVDYGADGIIYRKVVKRSVPKNDSPLSTSVKLLLEGPDVTKNTEKDCLTLIPENTRLLSAKVEDGIAYLNFSEEFEFNSYGVDGYRGQLMQVVYTATSFSTVKSVQFLIEGQKREYLGSEGQRIGSPLSRNSF